MTRLEGKEATTMGQSCGDLLAWLNKLFQLNYTKIEQLGTGPALCRIIGERGIAAKRVSPLHSSFLPDYNAIPLNPLQQALPRLIPN